MKGTACVKILPFLITCMIISFTICYTPVTAHGQTKIGVIFVIHGGMDTYEPQYMWDSSVQQFSYDPNHSIYKFVIWNSFFWPLVLDPAFTDYAVRFIRMYAFEYERIGGTDPFHTVSEAQMADMKAELDKNPYGVISPPAKPEA